MGSKPLAKSESSDAMKCSRGRSSLDPNEAARMRQRPPDRA